MTAEVRDQMEALIQALLNSDEYQNYVQYEKQLTKNPELWQRVDEFRSRNFRLQEQDDIDLFDAVDQLEKEYADLQNNTLVNAYLESESSICKTLQKIQGEMMERICVSVPERL